MLQSITRFPEFVFNRSVIVTSTTIRHWAFVLCGAALWIVVGSEQIQAQVLTGSDVVLTAEIPTIDFTDNTGPNQTWRMLAFDEAFRLEDTTNVEIPFLISTGAPTGTFGATAGGDIGLGTFNPSKKLHVFGAAPTIRLQESSNFNYTYDIHVDLGGVSIDDITAGTVPFFILPGAPSNSLRIAANGNLGMGTNNPVAGLHMVKPAQGSTAEAMAKFTVSDDSIGSLTISNHSASNNVFIPKIVGRSAGTNVAFMNEAVVGADSGTGPAITYNVVKGAGGGVTSRSLVAYRNNNVAKVTIGFNGDVFATSFSPVSSRTKKHDIADLESGRAAEALRQLTPVEFVYNDDETGEKRIGFIAEDVPEIVANPDRQSVPIMDVVGLLTRVVKDQQQTIDQQKMQLDNQQQTITGQKQALDGQQQAIARQQASVEELMRRLNILESQLKDR